ncbi:hypothetical protein IWZ00DRAFT_95042 [Phyllosticta capitalensis]
MEWLGICRSISSCSPCKIIMGRTNAPRADPRVHHLLPVCSSATLCPYTCRRPCPKLALMLSLGAVCCYCCCCCCCCRRGAGKEEKFHQQIDPSRWTAPLSRFVSARSRVATTLAAKKGLGQDSPSSLVRMCSTKSTLKRRRRGSASRVRESTTYLQLKSSM